jgi:hypothetical protein
MRIACYQTHPACDLFPLMSDPELDDLAQDIRRNGLRAPIVLDHDQILDGRNRLLACLRVNAEARFERWKGSGSPVAWLVSVNLHRRHLSPSQRAMIAARALTVLEAEARARQGRRTDLGAILRESERGRASEKAAALVGVAPRTVDHAKVVLRQGSPGVVEAVERGALSVSAAAALAYQPKNGHSGSGQPPDLPANERQKVLQSSAARDRNTPGKDRGQFEVLAAFPEWSQEEELRRYRSLNLDEIAADGATLFLAVPDALLPRALRVLTHWHFRYSSSIVLMKARPDDETFVRRRHELLLIGTRGTRPPVPSDGHRSDSIVEFSDTNAEARREAVLERIDWMFPRQRKVQLFARSARSTWSTRP